MNRRNASLRDILKVAFSRAVSLASGVAVGLLLPKVLGVEDYALLKKFTMYLTYTSLLHFGFVDGVLLELAGTPYEDLNREKTRAYSRFFLVFQLVIGGGIALAALAVEDPDTAFILLMLGINMVLINLTTYYQFISQATERFSEYAAKSYLIAGVKLALVVLLLAARQLGWWQTGYRLYILCLNLLDGSMLLWYVVIYRDITFGKKERLRALWPEIGRMFRSGILLTVAYQASHLLLMLDRQFVSVLYENTVYAHYAFAYNLVTIISTMVSSLSVVLLPRLKRANRDYIQSNYSRILAMVAGLVCFAVAGYFPLVEFIRWFLPEYTRSLVYLRIVLPSLTFSCCVSVVMFTFSKVLEENGRFLRNSCLAMALGAALNLAAWRFFGTPEAISYASLLTMMFWFWSNGRLIGKKIGAGIIREFGYLCAAAGGFLAITGAIPGTWAALGAYLVFITGLTLAVFRRDIIPLFKKVKNV